MLRRRPSSFKHRRGQRKPSPTRTPIPLLEELKSTSSTPSAPSSFRPPPPPSSPSTPPSPPSSRIAGSSRREIFSRSPPPRSASAPTPSPTTSSYKAAAWRRDSPARGTCSTKCSRRGTAPPWSPTMSSSGTKNGDLGTGASLKEEIVRRGVQPNAITFALLIDALCQEGNYAAAKKMMFDMEYQGCKAGLANYGVLMSDHGRRGDLDGVRALLAEMKRRKLKPDVPIYGALINYLCGAGRAAEAYAVLVEMQVEGGCEPNAAAYRMMADGACRARDFEMASRVATAMVASGHCPREDTFRCLMNGLCGIGKVEAACSVLEEMARRKMELDGNGGKALVEATVVPAKPEQQLGPVQFNSTQPMTL